MATLEGYAMFTITPLRSEWLRLHAPKQSVSKRTEGSIGLKILHINIYQIELDPN